MKTPPKDSLGIHAFHPNTANGDCIEVDGKVEFYSSRNKFTALVFLWLYSMNFELLNT